MKSKFLVSALFCAVFAGGAFAQQVVYLRTYIAPDGKSEIKERLLEECVVALPGMKELKADVQAGTEFLKEINGEPGKNEHTKVYTASVKVSYKVRQKILLIITKNNLSDSEPVTREETRETMKEAGPFLSDPNGGDLFAGRSRRKYYYSTAEGAAENAEKQAQIWLNQQQNVLCSVGKK